MTKIGVLGLWHLGCVYSASFADKKNLNVIGFDAKKSVVKNLQKGTPPLFEPGLEDLIKKNLGKNLNYTSDSKSAISGKDYVFITLDTPVDKRDRVQMKSFYSLFSLVKKYISANTILVISSQIPIGTCRVLQNQVGKLRKNVPVIYFPENLRLGQAIQTFLEPDRIIVGADSQKVLKQFLLDFSLFKCPVLEMSLESAEMAKHSLNSYLATLISFCSEISDLCELTGADAQMVMKALKIDARVSPNAPLNPGIGFAGGTLGRDLQTLKMIAKKINYVPKLTNVVYKVNNERLPHLVKKISGVLGSLKGKRIGLLGLTYKPNTNTLRRSQSLELATSLQSLGVVVSAIDPAIRNSAGVKSLTIYHEYDKFFQNLDAVILMTWWEEFKKIDPTTYSTLMKKKVVFDTRNYLEKDIWEKAGFLYVGVGNGEKLIKASK